MTEMQQVRATNWFRDVFARFADMSIEPDPHWRTVAPADCIGYPHISVGYQNELMELARQRGLPITKGCIVTASYEKRDGEWHPIPDTVEVQ